MTEAILTDEYFSKNEQKTLPWHEELIQDKEILKKHLESIKVPRFCKICTMEIGDKSEECKLPICCICCEGIHIAFCNCEKE